MLRDLGHAHAAEESQFDEFGSCGLRRLQGFKRLVQGENVFVAIHTESLCFDQIEILGAAAAFCAESSSRLVDKNLSHRGGSYSEEVRPVFPRGFLDPNQLQERFVDQFGGLKHGLRSSPQMGGSKHAQLAVDRFGERLERGTVSRPDLS